MQLYHIHTGLVCCFLSATLLSLRVLPEFKKKAVWTRAYGWWTALQQPAASSAGWGKSQKWKEFSRIHVWDRWDIDPHSEWSWNGSHITEAWHIHCQEEGYVTLLSRQDWKQEHEFSLYDWSSMWRFSLWQLAYTFFYPLNSSKIFLWILCIWLLFVLRHGGKVLPVKTNYSGDSGVLICFPWSLRRWYSLT